MRFSDAMSNVATTVLVVCALVVTGLLIRRELSPDVNRASPPPVDDWTGLARSETTVGPQDAEDTIIEFMDYQCPYCIAVHPTLDSLLAATGRSLKLVIRHFPLPSHEQAVPAAVFADCAAREVGFAKVHPVLLQNPALVDSANWDSLAILVGAKGLSELTGCQADTEVLQSVLDSREEVAALGVRYTPTFLVNGQWATGVQSGEEFEQMLKPQSIFARLTGR